MTATESTAFLLALASPWLLGSLYLFWFWRDTLGRYWPLLHGYGYITGMLAITLLMRLFDYLGIGLHFYSLQCVILLLILIAAWRCLPHWHLPRLGPTGSGRRGGFWHYLLCAGLMALIIIRLAGLGLEILLRPLYPWDAWISWSAKARIWYEHGTIVDIVPPFQWFRTLPEQSYNTFGTDNPITVSLIQTWTNLPLAEWHDILINLPWLFCAIALAMVFFGYCRLWTNSVPATLLLTYLLVSMPFLNAHIALAGYADLWMAAANTLCVLALIQWLKKRQSGFLIIALVFALLLPTVKETGLLFSLLILPLLLAALLPLLWNLAIALLIAASVWALFYVGVDTHVPLLGRVSIHTGGIDLPYSIRTREWQPILAPLIKNLFSFVNWHLFFYALLVCAISAVAFLRKNRIIVSVLVYLVLGYGLFILLFGFTRVSVSVLSGTATNRIPLPLIPVALFFCFLVVSDLAKNWSLPRTS